MLGTFLIGQIPLFVEEFARAGGGGSGGGSGSGGGGILFVIGLIGYLPMYGLGKLLSLGKYDHARWVVLQIIGWVIAGLIALTLIVIMVLSNSFALGFIVYVPIAVGALVGMAGGLYALFGKLRQGARVSNALRIAEAKDYSWNEKNLQKYAEGIFLKFQQDWSDFNMESMGRYLTPGYQNHINLMLHALNGAHRHNKMLDIRIKKSLITDVRDSENDAHDVFVIGFTATANDQLYDTRDGKMLFQDKNEFTEFWRFVRSGSHWLLDSIEQATENKLLNRNDIRQFAYKNHMYYSPDWGWLLLPRDGYLFSSGKFGVADINNHTIGFVNNVLTQLYTYQPRPSQNTVNPEQYLVIQTNVPKTYGRILVKRRSKFINWPVIGLTKVKMEWGEFNDMYDVYASDMERVTSFELLNPAFMAHLRDLPFEVNIEVVDNVVYIFTKANTNLEIYGKLYDILLKAHKEMKL